MKRGGSSDVITIQDNQHGQRYKSTKSFVLEREDGSKVEVCPDQRTSISGLPNTLQESETSNRKLWGAVSSALSPYLVYNISYLSEEDTINVAGLIKVDPTTGYCCIPRPLVIFKDNVWSAIKKAKEEVPGQVVLYFFAAIGLYSSYQVLKSIWSSFRKKKLTRADIIHATV